MNWLVRGVVLVVMSSALLAPELASAQLVPCDGGPGNPCSTCDLVALANQVIGWLIGILFLIFAILMTVAGVQLVTSRGNQAALDAAKSKFSNALIGIIIVMSAWILVDTLLKFILRTNPETGTAYTSLGPWNEIDCFLARPPLEGDPNRNSFTDGTAEEREFLDSIEVAEGNDGVVEFAEEMMRRGCIYDQSRRNGCAGNPGYTDCSDLVNTAFQAAGLRSPGTYTGNMIDNAREIGDPSNLMPGDALIYRTGGRGHVVICQDRGCNRVIHASGRGRNIIEGNGSSYLSRDDIGVIRAQEFVQ